MDIARYLAATRGGEPEDYLAAQGIDELAAKLHGEVTGPHKINCPSPGRPDDDRSCHVRLDPARRDKFFIYDCEGASGAAYAMVRAALGVVPPRRSNGDAIDKIWAETVPGAGSLVEKYLRSRAITLAAPPALRFHPALKHPDGDRWPAMVAERLDVHGRRVALHRTFLRGDGGGKAPVSPPRMDLGATASAAIRLAGVAEELLVGEGIETTLAVMQAARAPGWAAGSAGALRRLALPDEVRSVVICADGDEAGEAAARAAATRWISDGRRVRIARAPAGKDFNDLLMEAIR